MAARKRDLSMLCACLAISTGLVACGGSDGASSEKDLPTTQSAETAPSSLDVVSVEWSSFCASEQDMLQGDLRAMTMTPLDSAQLEDALAPRGTPISDDAADLLAVLDTLDQTWDVLGTAIVNAMVDVSLDLDDPGWTLVTGEQGVLLVNFMYETEGSPLPLPVEQEAIAFSNASSALAAKARELGLDDCRLLIGDSEQTEPDSSSTATAPPEAAPTPTAPASTTTTDMPTTRPSYEAVLAAYGDDAELCTTEAEVKGQRPDGSLEVDVQGGTLVVDDRVEFPCFGVRLLVITQVSVGGTDYPAGSVLVVDPTTDESALRDGVEIGNPVVLETEGLVITVGSTVATWDLSPDVGLLRIDESVTVISTPEPGEQGSAQLPDEFWGLTEQEALDLATSSGIVARVTVRDGQWLPETDDYSSGRFNFIVEAGIVVDGWIET